MTPSATLGIPLTPNSECAGDCNADDEVTIDELLRLANIAQGLAPASACSSGDLDGSNGITIDEILQAVNRALLGC